MIQVMLTDLLTFNKPIEFLETQMQNVPWDIDPLVTFTYKNLESILNKFLNKEISSDEITRWAEFVELRDGIKYEHINGRIKIDEVIFQLANPEINSEITKDLILRLKENLEI